MGLTAFNRMRRQQEAKKAASKLKDADIKKVRELCEEIGIKEEAIKTAIQALKAGTVTADQLIADLENHKAEISSRDDSKNEDTNHEQPTAPTPELVDEEPTEPATTEEAQATAEPSEADVPVEGVVDEVSVEETADKIVPESQEAAEAPNKKTASRKNQNNKNR